MILFTTIFISGSISYLLSKIGEKEKFPDINEYLIKDIEKYYNKDNFF